MDDWEDRGFWFSVAACLKAGSTPRPPLPGLVLSFLAMVWIAFGLRALAAWMGSEPAISGQVFQFLADPLAALVSGGLLVYWLKSKSTRGGQVMGVAAILAGVLFATYLAGGLPAIEPLWIFQLVLTYLMGWVGGAWASGRFQRRGRRVLRRAIAQPAAINRSGLNYRKLLGLVSANYGVADRLVNYERSLHPQLSSEQLAQDAADRLIRDRR